MAMFEFLRIFSPWQILTDPRSPLDVYWVLPRALAGMALPEIHAHRLRGQGAGLADFADDLPALWEAGVRGIVCLLDYPELQRAYVRAGFACCWLPVADGGAPGAAQFEQFLTFRSEEHTSELQSH